MKKRSYTNTCTCQDIEFTIKYAAEEEIEEFFCPFCGSSIEEAPDMRLDNEEEDIYDYGD